MTRILIPLLPFLLAVLAPLVAALAPEPEPLRFREHPGWEQAIKAHPAITDEIRDFFG